MNDWENPQSISYVDWNEVELTPTQLTQLYNDLLHHQTLPHLLVCLSCATTATPAYSEVRDAGHKGHLDESFPAKEKTIEYYIIFTKHKYEGQQVKISDYTCSLQWLKE